MVYAICNDERDNQTEQRINDSRLRRRNPLRGFRGPRPADVPATTKISASEGHLVIPFEDNRLIANLLGEYDSNLAIIEDRLGVEAVARGNVVTLKGPDDSCLAAKAILEDLYARLASGEPIGPGEVEGAIRHSGAGRHGGTKRRRKKGEERTILVDEDKRTSLVQVRTRKRLITARTPTQSDYLRELQDKDLVFATGPAGTGKTYLAVAFAAACLEHSETERLILSRPAVEAGERLGFLPGDMRDKVDPYLRPLYDALYDVLPPELVERGLESGVIEIAPLAFMRGRTLSHAFVILDEAQNCSAMQIKMFLTRLGDNSKMVVTGDPTQIDLPTGQSSGLEGAITLLKDIDGISHIPFTKSDVVRRELVAKIVEAYDQA